MGKYFNKLSSLILGLTLAATVASAAGGGTTKSNEGERLN